MELYVWVSTLNWLLCILMHIDSQKGVEKPEGIARQDT